MKILDMELRLAQWFGFVQNIIVPNVSWGMKLHECDLLIMSKKGYLTEVEIKTSLSDLKNDIKKRHEHNDEKIKNLYFAIPEKLEKHIAYIPSHAGIIVLHEKQIYNDVYRKGIKEIRKPYSWIKVLPLSNEEQFQLARLGTMRIWMLKHKLKKARDKKCQ